MTDKSKFQRTFLIFKQEDGGFGAGQAPSGYVKIEVRDGRGKLTAVVQNLKEEQNKYTYKLYILKNNESDVYPVYVGVIPMNRNKGELRWEFEPQSVDKSGYHIDEFSAALVLAESGESEDLRLICPLAAYKGGRFNWREKLRTEFRLEKSRIDEKSKTGTDKKVKDEPEAKGMDACDDKNGGENFEGRDMESKSTVDVESKYNPVENSPELNIYKFPEDSKTDQDGNIESDASDTIAAGSTESSAEESFESSADESVESGPVAVAEHSEEIFNYESTNAEESSINGCNSSNTENECGNWDSGQNPADMADSCSPMSNNGTGVQTDQTYNPCLGCYMNYGRNIPEKDENVPGDLEKLKSNLGKYFETYNPFNSRRRDYQWWKVPSPVYLNNLMYQCNIKTPLLFNPAVMMSHFKYRYLIIGIYTDSIRGREYIVCGIPGAYNMDQKPFGDMCHWVQLEGSKPRHGAFGYWLVYMDPKTGKLLNMN